MSKEKGIYVNDVKMKVSIMKVKNVDFRKKAYQFDCKLRIV